MEAMAASAACTCLQKSNGLAKATFSPSTCAFLLHNRAAEGVSLKPSSPPSARFLGLLSSSARTRAATLNVFAIHALDPDFYKIPYVEGVPVGKKLKLWNLPPNCKHSELLEWFAGVNVKVETLEFTDDPGLNAQGIGGFVELATKQDACIAIVRLDGYKFRGHYIRLDFAEKRPHQKGYGSRRNRNSMSFTTSPRPSLPNSSSSSDRSISGTPQSASSNGVASIGHGFGGSNQTDSVNSMSPGHDNGSDDKHSFRYANNGVGHIGSNVSESRPIMPSIGNTNPSSPPGYNSLPTMGAQSATGYATNYSSMRNTPHYKSGNAHSPSGYGNVPTSGPQTAPIYATTTEYESNTLLGSSQANTSYGNVQPSPGYDNIITSRAGTLAPTSGADSSVQDGSYSTSTSVPSYGPIPAAGNPHQGSTGSTSSDTSNNYSFGSGQYTSSYDATSPSSSTTNINQWSPTTSTSGSIPSSMPRYSNGSYGSNDMEHESIETEVEQWSSNMTFRSGPMYGSPHPSSLNRVFVGNLAPSVDAAALHHLFSRFGTVLEARVLHDQESGRSRGVGVVAMLNVDEMRSASETLNGWRLENRPLKVNSVACRR